MQRVRGRRHWTTRQPQDVASCPGERDDSGDAWALMSLRQVASESPAPSPGEAAPGSAGHWQRLTEAQDAGEYCRAWLALQCDQLTGVRAALLLLQSETGSFVPAAVWPGVHTDVTYLAPLAEQCLRARAGQIDQAAQAEGHVLAAYPIELGGQLFGAVVLDLTWRPQGELQSALQSLHWGTGRLESILFQRRLEEHGASLARSTMALELLADIGEPTRLDEAAMRLADELAVRLHCERVAVALGSDGRVRLQALSGAAWFERKTDFVAALENAMEEAIDQGRSVSWPPLPGNEGVISVAHRDLVDAGAAYTVVLKHRGRAIGAITCRTEAPRDAAFVQSLEAVAALVAPQLALRKELDRWVTGAWIARGRELLHALRDPRRPSFRVGAIVVVLVAVVLGWASGEYRVAARAVVEGEVQRAIVAPFDGFVASVNRRAGQTVRAGDVLATLDDRDLALERQRWISESEQAERKYRDALAKHERTNARILAAQLEEASAQLGLVEDKLSRSQLSAPFDGVVVNGDLSQMLGSPVEKGKLLFEVAPLDAYRVILKVPEEDIRYVKAEQTGQIVLAAMAGRPLAFAVKNIGVASAEEGQNLFRVEARLTDAAANLRPGMEGVGKIEVGERRYLWIWTHSLVDWLSLKLWHWLP
jgi:multidrug efflux pump subunit AcrA (membrane-fusion protein)